MRVVAGTAKGRRLVAPPGRKTRPTSDRVREAIFNTLYSARSLDGARVLDLFAGSGAMGIEALSRGAARATFVDSDRAAIEAITTNLATTGFAATGQAVVLQANAETYVTDNEVGAVGAAEAVDVVFADPPYAFEGWDALLTRTRGDLMVAESDHPIEPAARWEVLKIKQYSAPGRRGGAVVTFLARR